MKKYIHLSTVFILVGFLLRLLIAVSNAYFGFNFGADADAMVFHENGVIFSSNPNFDAFDGASMYSYWLGFLYYLIAKSLFLGNLFSVIAWLLSAYFLKKSMILMHVKSRLQTIAIIIYALLPSSLILTSITLRESYELLFVNLSFFALIKIYLQENNLYWGVLLGSLFFASLLHGGLIVYAIIFFTASVYLVIISKYIKLKSALLVFSLILSGFVYTNIDYIYDVLGQGEQVTQQYLESSSRSGARAMYRDDFKIDGVTTLITYPLTVFVQYFIEPLPWRSLSSVDFVVVIENALRLLLIYTVLVNILPPNYDKRKKVIITLFISYLCLELMWSAGTINWGTASRHHLPGMGLLLILAFSSKDLRLRQAILTK